MNFDITILVALINLSRIDLRALVWLFGLVLKCQEVVAENVRTWPTDNQLPNWMEHPEEVVEFC